MVKYNKVVAIQYAERQVELLEIICEHTNRKRGEHLREALDKHIEKVGEELSKKGIHIWAEPAVK